MIYKQWLDTIATTQDEYKFYKYAVKYKKDLLSDIRTRGQKAVSADLNVSQTTLSIVKRLIEWI